MTQPTFCTTAQNKIFRNVYMSQPEVLSRTGDNVTELMLHSIKTTLGWFTLVRERFCGGSFDGQYFKLNVLKHLAAKLSRDSEFTEDALIWDVAQRIELACDDVKKIIP